VILFIIIIIIIIIITEMVPAYDGLKQYLGVNKGVSRHTMSAFLRHISALEIHQGRRARVTAVPALLF
jgi:hypothetical protein